jgi:hypothetical protein
MHRAAELLERGIPDAVSTRELPAALAAEIDFLAGRTDAWETERTDIAASIRARALALRGRFEPAREIMTTLDARDLDVQGLVAAAWAVSRVGPDDLVPSLLARLDGETDEFLSQGDLPLGPRSTVAGLLAAGAGRLDRSVDFFDDAVRVGDARAPLWGALARLEQARVVHCVEAVGVGDDSGDTSPAAADHALISARTFFGAGGYGSLLTRCDAVDRAVDSWSAPGGGRLIPGTRWTIGFGVQPPVDVRPSKGLLALHYLITNRHRSVPAVELDLAANGDDPSPIADLFAAGPLEVFESDDHPDLAVRLRESLFDDVVRSRVTKLLRRSVSKLGESHRLLGAHLDAAIHTGYGCRYQPTAPFAISWQL